MPHKNLHADFAAGLINPDVAVPDGVVDPQGRPAPKRYGVYRNNVTISLIEAMKSAYPAICVLIGEEPFTQIARAFVRAHPPQSPLMIHYGAGFDDYLNHVEPLKHLPFLADVARLERLWLDSYHAADAEKLDAQRMTTVTPDQWADASFLAHPSARIMPSDFPIFQIWSGAKSGKIKNVQPHAEWVLLTRPEVEVLVHAVSPAAGKFIECLMAGEKLGTAMEVASAIGEFDVQSTIGLMLGAGAFTEFSLGEK